MAIQTLSEMKAQIRDRAAEDEDFRSRLIEDPKSVISEEFGVFIPEDFNLHMHEDSATTEHVAVNHRLRAQDAIVWSVAKDLMWIVIMPLANSALWASAIRRPCANSPPSLCSRRISEVTLPITR